MESVSTVPAYGAPDKAASGLLEGRIVLAVDNSPGVLILPATYQMFFRRETIITHDLK